MSSKSTRKAQGKKRAASPAPEETPATAAAAAAPTVDAEASDSAAAAEPQAKRAKRAPTTGKKAAATNQDETKKDDDVDMTTAAAAAAAAVPPSPRRSARSASVASSSAASVSAAAAPASVAHPTPLSLATLFTTTKGHMNEVFTFGSGDCSQLGNGSDEKLRERKKPTLVYSLAQAKVNAVCVAAGSLHNLVLDSQHAVWSWGCNDDHALGHAEDEWYPARVAGPLGFGRSRKSGIEAAQIACGASHSLALTVDGDVYCWGTFRDANGVIGFSDELDAAKEPMKMSFGTKHKIVMIAAGEHHDLALTENGEVYQWGDIGIGRRFSDRKKKNKLTPSRVVFKKAGGVAAPKRFVRIFAGGHASYALDEHGVAWVWGPNNYNQVGLPKTDTELMILTPTPLTMLPPLAKVACSTHHSLFLTRDGKVFSTGRGEDGRLGHGDKKHKSEPTEIAILSSLPHGDVVIDINCGEGHSLAVTKEGRLYTFGYGDLLQLGNGIEEDVLEPQVVESAALDGGEEEEESDDDDDDDDDAAGSGDEETKEDDADEKKGKKGGKAKAKAKAKVSPKKKAAKSTMKATEYGRRVLQACGGAQHSILLAIERTTKPAWFGEAKKEKVIAAPKTTEVKKITSLAAFLPTSGWECQACMLQNPDSLTKCRACETPKDGAAAAAASSAAPAAAAASTGAPVFAFAAAAPASAFTFGAPAATFGAAAPAADTTAAAAAPPAPFVPPATTNFTFGAPAGTTGGFTFGAQ